MIPILGVDVSEMQPPGLPWAAWHAAGARVAVVRASIGFLEDKGYERFVTLAAAAGYAVGAYHALLGHQWYDPTRQAKDFIGLIMPQVQFCVLDIEAPGTSGSDVYWFAQYYGAHGPDLPLLLYGNMDLERLIGPDTPYNDFFADYGLWVADYGPGTPTGVPLNKPRIPRVGKFKGHQFAGDNGRLAPYPGQIDLTSWAQLPTAPTEAPVITPNHIKLGPHHMQGGNTTGDWLQLVPTVAKFVGDLGASVDARPGTLTIGRLVDDKLLDGQGFDVNRYTDAGADPLERAAAYIRLLRPLIDSNPHVQAWEGPNEQILRSDDKAEAADPAMRAHYDADRQRFMEWYADFAYAFAAGLHALGKRAGIGSWASGQPRPEHNLWRFWTRALQATVDFGAIECRHDYAGIDVTGLLRCVYDNGEFERLGYVGVPQVITELGADVDGTGWRQLFRNDIGACYAQLIRPWLDQVANRPWFLGACWYTDGGRGWENYDVSGTQIVSYLAGYQAPPPEETMPISKAQQAQYLADLDTAASKVAVTRAAIAALVPDDVAHWWDAWPAGVLNPPRQLAALPTAIPMRDAAGAPMVPAIKRGNAMTVFERQGDLLRVLAAPINGQLWWVLASDLPVPAPAG